MKIHRMILSALLLCTCCMPLAACGGDSSASGMIRGGFVRTEETEGYAELHAEPDASSECIAQLTPDTQIVLLGDTKNGWCHVQYNGTEGWLPEENVTYTARTSVWSTAPVTTTEETTSTAKTAKTETTTDTTDTTTTASSLTHNSSTYMVEIVPTEPYVPTETEPPVTDPPDTAPTTVQTPEPPQTETRATQPVEHTVGSVISFGAYEQDNDGANGAEPIRWIVLDATADAYLLLSCDALDAQPYHSSADPVTWETCALRRWLNDDFLGDAFTAEQQQQIVVSAVMNADNAVSGTSGGNNTLDQVFLLSLDEAETYLSQEAQRDAVPTAYAVARGVQTGENGCAQWWLRSPGSNESRAAIIMSSGAPYTDGLPADGSYQDAGVRPCIWLRK